MAEKKGEININLHHKQALALNSIATEELIGGSAGGGKLQPLDAKVLTPFGWRLIGELKVGDQISDPTTGGVTRVIAIHPQGAVPVYRAICDDGSTTEVGLDHLWAYHIPRVRRPRTKPSSQRAYAESQLGGQSPRGRWNNYRIGKTTDLIRLLKGGQKPRIPLSEPILFSVNGHVGGLPAYLAGILLGDGCNQTLSVTSCDDEVRDYLLGLGFIARGDLWKDGKAKTYFAQGPIRKRLDTWLRSHELRWCRSWEKFIPSYVFTASIEYRVEFLRGLMDTDGTVDDRGHLSFCSTSQRLSEGVMELVRGLGGKATRFEKNATYSYKGEKLAGRLAHNVYIWLPAPDSVFHIKRKKQRCLRSWNGGAENMRVIESVEYSRDAEAVCITVDSPYGLYITDDYIVTHNSFCMRAGAILWCTAIPGLQVYLFRRIREDLVKNHMEGPKGFRSLLAPWVAAGFVVIVEDEIRFWNGAKLYLCHCKDPKDVYKYQGAEIHVLLIDELTHFLEDMYRFLRNRVRMVGIKLPEGYEGRFPRILCSANPGNIGHQFVKSTFIDDCQPMEIRHMPQSEGGMLRQFIPARLEDNPSMAEDDPGYEQRLMGLGSEALVRAMRYGDWSAVDGAFFDCWKTEKHVIRPFEIPPHWARVRGMDWGSAAPFSVGWYAIASEPMNVPNGQGGTVHLPRGCAIQYREWYGAEKPNVGLKLTAEVVGAGIAKRDNGEKIHDEVLDPSAFAHDGGPSIAERIYEGSGKKVNFRRADNTRVSRKGAMGGWDLVRARLVGDGDGNPMLVFFSTCSNLIRTLPVIQHDKINPEDCDSDMEDHAIDGLRYFCASRPWTAPTSVVIPLRGAAEMTMKEAWAKARPKSGVDGRI